MEKDNIHPRNKRNIMGPGAKERYMDMENIKIIKKTSIKDLLWIT